MLILVINAGSSSLKYQLVNMPEQVVVARGIVDRIGLDGSLVDHTVGNKKHRYEQNFVDHEVALDFVLNLLINGDDKVIDSWDQIDVIGHRVVHGGSELTKTTIIDDKVLKIIQKYSNLAPLHNPANIAGIKAFQKLMPGVMQVATFDTAFHYTLPPENYMYAIPYKYYQKYSIRKYGFHGISHQYVSSRACEFLNLDFDKQKIISCHLGSGASITAICDGKVIDTSLGFTPVEGLVMGTRAGDVCSSIVNFLEEKEGLSNQEIDNILNTKSGLLGLSGKSSDMREILDGYQKGEERCILALDVYIARIIKYIGAYIAELGGIDVLIFTAGVGEKSPFVRKKIVEKLKYFGLKLDESSNIFQGDIDMLISHKTSKANIVAIPTNEELMIAYEAYNLKYK